MKSKIHVIPEIRFRSLPSVDAYLLVCRGWLKMEKTTKIAAAFIQNKANFKNIEIGISSFETSKYETSPAWRGEKTNPIKPNLSQNKPNSNPIPERP